MLKFSSLILLIFVALFSQPIIENKNKPTKGVYRSFNDFLNNKPDLANHDIFLVKGKKLCEYADNKTNKIKGEIWGYSSGKNILIHHGNRYIGLTLNTLYSSFTIKKEIQQTQTTGFFGGSTMKSKPFVDDSFHEPTKYRYKYFAVDMSSGEIFRLTDSKVLEIISSDTELVKKFKETQEYYGILVDILNEFQNRK